MIFGVLEWKWKCNWVLASIVPFVIEVGRFHCVVWAYLLADMSQFILCWM